MSEKCPNTEFFLVRIFPYLNWIRENTDKKNLRICTLFTQWLCDNLRVWKLLVIVKTLAIETLKKGYEIYSKLSKRDSRAASMTSVWYHHFKLWTDFTHCSNVSIVAIEQVNTDWDYVWSDTKIVFSLTYLCFNTGPGILMLWFILIHSKFKVMAQVMLVKITKTKMMRLIFKMRVQKTQKFKKLTSLITSTLC